MGSILGQTTQKGVQGGCIAGLLDREIGQLRRIRLKGRSLNFLKATAGGRFQAGRLQLGDDLHVVADQFGLGSR